MTKYLHTMIRVSSLEDSIAFFEVLGLQRSKTSARTSVSASRTAVETTSLFSSQTLSLLTAYSLLAKG